jgi:ABC-type uncharacterized transport system involved in gliding motility auxiliary subunit
MEVSVRREYAKAAGWAALGLLALTGVTYAVRGAADLWLWLPLGAGVVSAALWLVEFRGEALEVVRSRRARQGGQSVIYSLAVVAIVVLLQGLAVNSGLSVDLTKNKTFTLSDETVKVVKALDQKVDFMAFYGNENREAFEDLLKRVKELNPSKVDYEFVNLNRNPLLAQEYGVRALGTTVLVAGDKKETLTGATEEDVLNALVKVSSGQTKQIYVLAGHQEHSVDDIQPQGLSGLQTGLEAASFGVHTLNLATDDKGEVPEDAAALIISGPRTDLLPPELDALTRYLGRGGRVFVALDPRVQVPGLKAWLAKAGVHMDADIVIDLNPFNQLFGGSPVAPIIQTFDPEHAITKDLAEQKGQAIFPTTSTISTSRLPLGATVTVLARTLPTAFGWTGKGDNAPTRPGPNDKRGPLDLMVALDEPVSDFGGDPAAPAGKTARLVVLGTSVLMDNQADGAFNNQDLVVNSLRWLADEEQRISLAPKPADNEPILLDLGRQHLIWWSIILLALGALGAGVAVAATRRRAV